MKYTQNMIEVGSLVVGMNPRIPNRMLVDSLKDSIVGIGLKEPLHVWELPGKKGIFQVIKGHRRLMAINEILSENPARFAELFGKGIPCQKFTDVTEEDVIHMKLDHSDQLGLRDPHELQRSANMLFAIGKVEADVALELAGLIDQISPMNDKARQKLAVLKETEAKAVKEGNTAGIELAKRDIRDFIFQYRRGFVQNLHNIYRCPDVVMAALYKKACGQTPQGFEGVALPPITTSQAVSLYKAHQKDLELKSEDGVPLYNKTVTGPNFNKAFAELVEKAKEAESRVETARPKAMAAKDIEEEGKGYKSAIAVKLCNKHRGAAAPTDLAVLDEAAYCTDVVRKHNPPAWAAFVKLANEEIAKLAAAAPKA